MFLFFFFGGGGVVGVIYLSSHNKYMKYSFHFHIHLETIQVTRVWVLFIFYIICYIILCYIYFSDLWLAVMRIESNLDTCFKYCKLFDREFAACQSCDRLFLMVKIEFLAHPTEKLKKKIYWRNLQLTLHQSLQYLHYLQFFTYQTCENIT